MLSDSMSLIEMINFMPSEIDMATLPLDIVVYAKVSIVSVDKEINYEFIRHLFNCEDINEYIKDIKDISFYDFDATRTNQERFVTIFEMYSLYNYINVSEYLKEILEKYDHKADVIIDLFTHDDKQYRLSNLDGIIKLEECKKAV